MRVIGHVADEGQARVFADFLYVRGIENQIEFHKEENSWAIWIRDEDKLQPATTLLSDFKQNPRDPRFEKEGKAAGELRLKEEKSNEAYRKKLEAGRERFQSLAAYGLGPLTLVLIAISVFVFLFSRFAHNLEAVHSLFISEQLSDHRGFAGLLPEVRHGQVWRLVTPIFIHMGIWHILFNMLWLRDLGTMIESRLGSLQLAILVLVLAAGSNFAQYYISGPIFGGMSGVVYGLLGFIWLRGKSDPASGLFLHPTTVNMMLIWLVLCYTGLLGPVANTAHVVGLALGAALGYASGLARR